MPLPNREYYPIEKAAKKLNCDIDDLIHFIAMRKMNFWINICLHETLFFSEYKNADSYDFCDDDEECGNDIKHHYISKNKLTETTLNGIFDSLIHSETFSRNDSGEIITKCHEWKKFISWSEFHKLKVSPSEILEKNYKQPIRGYPKTIKLSINGLMNVTEVSADIENITRYNNEDTEVSFIAISSPNRNEFSDHVFTYIYNRKIKINDIYISQDELETINNGGRLYSYPINKKEAASGHSTKTQNAQAKVIKTLIEAIGGRHAANHPRNAIDNPNSELNKALDRAGVKLPASGVTVDKWLKGID